MSLTSEIQNIVESLQPDSTYTLSSAFNANRSSYSIDRVKYPFIILDNELSKQVEIRKNNNLVKDTRIVISVLTLDKRDNTDTQREALRLSMESIADRIAVNIYQLDSVSVQPGVNQTYGLNPLFNAYITGLSGVAMEMRVNYKEVVNFCTQ